MLMINSAPIAPIIPQLILYAFQEGVMSEMTLLRLTDEKAALVKDVERYESQMVDARRTIRNMTKQLKSLQIASRSMRITKNQLIQVDVSGTVL